MRSVRSLFLVLVIFALAGCTPREPVAASRESLGTVVTITAYGDHPDAVRSAVDDAFAAIEDAAAPLDVYDPGSEVSAFNASPYEPHTLPPAACKILDTVDDLGMSDAFCPTLLAVSRLYGFESSPSVPADADRMLALRASRAFQRRDDGTASFDRLRLTDRRLDPGGALAPGLDFGGAAKGLALDAARESLRGSGAVTAAIISSGSSTVTLGTKPDGSVWRVGIEDPRDTSRIVAEVTFTGDGALSTSGDYQQYFEVDGIRYHHILDPATGLPARGLRSLTVAGSRISGLESDILSTALFVRGPEEAAAYATEHGLVLYAVDSNGQAHVVPAPEASNVTIAETAEPIR